MMQDNVIVAPQAGLHPFRLRFPYGRFSDPCWRCGHGIDASVHKVDPLSMRITRVVTD